MAAFALHCAVGQLRVNGDNTLDKFVRITLVASATWYSEKRKYAVVDVYDPNYPGMSPVTCVGPDSGMGRDETRGARVREILGSVQ